MNCLTWDRLRGILENTARRYYPHIYEDVVQAALIKMSQVKLDDEPGRVVEYGRVVMHRIANDITTRSKNAKLKTVPLFVDDNEYLAYDPDLTKGYIQYFLSTLTDKQKLIVSMLMAGYHRYEIVNMEGYTRSEIEVAVEQTQKRWKEFNQ